MTSLGSGFLIGYVLINLFPSPKLKLIHVYKLSQLTPAWCSWDSFGLQLPPSSSWWGPPASEVQARGRMQTGVEVVTPQTNPIRDHRRKFSNDKTLSRWRQEDSNHLKLHWPNSLGKMFFFFFPKLYFFTQNSEMHLHPL